MNNARVHEIEDISNLEDPKEMSLSIKSFPPSWFQIKTKGKIIYLDPAYLSTYFTKYPKKPALERAF